MSSRFVPKILWTTCIPTLEIILGEQYSFPLSDPLPGKSRIETEAFRNLGLRGLKHHHGILYNPVSGGKFFSSTLLNSVFENRIKLELTD